MKSRRKVKKELKKIYKEGLIKGHISNRSHFLKFINYRSVTLLCFKNINKHGHNSYELNMSGYDYYTGEYDSFDVTDDIKVKNKRTPYPVKHKKNKNNNFKFYSIDC